ncbi:MAG: hypothetical protein ACNI3C_10515 [Candidatus Marinarcus sp.]|uniref:flagellin N-terminal helical domain-containing protein n=1 Tax=Candidatus Marinarcus sp. TaxID=3100987 RepID=UPI003AFF8F5F
MDVSSINSNINNLGSVSQQNTQGVQSNSKVQSNEKDASNVTISEANKVERNALSLSIKALNEGIATTKIAQNGLDKQEEILNTIAVKLETIKSDDTTAQDKATIKDEIKTLIGEFKQTADTTKFNNKTLLNQAAEDQYLNITTPNADFSIELPNTANISNQLKISFSRNDVATKLGNEEFLSTVNENAQKIGNASKELKNIEKNIETVARDTIQEQINAYNSNAISNNVNFGKEALDFSKTNVTSQLGFLVSSQANTVQTQSIRLLS